MIEIENVRDPEPVYTKELIDLSIKTVRDFCKASQCQKCSYFTGQRCSIGNPGNWMIDTGVTT